MKKTSLLLSSLAIAATGQMLQAQTTGNIATIEAAYSGSAITATVNSSPIVTAVMSAPGTVDGYTYTKYGILAQDTSGSAEIYGILPASVVPTVGSALGVTGSYAPYQGIPEITTNSSASVSILSTGNTVPTSPVFTAAQLTATGATLPQNIEGYLVTIDNVTIMTNGTAAGGLNFPTHGNGTYSITDGTGTITLYQWASSYSAAGAFGGTVIPSGLVDITGLVDDYTSGGTSTSELIPYSIAAAPAPEPSTIALAALGTLSLLGLRRRK